MDNREEEYKVCPVCGRELGWDEQIYTYQNGDEVLGCEYCMTKHRAGDWL